MSYITLMYKTVISSKGQVVIPKNIRDKLGLRVGEQLYVEESGGGILLRKEACFPETNPEDVIGFIRTDKIMSLEEIESKLEEKRKQELSEGY